MLWFENNEYICQHLGRKQIAQSEWMIKEDLVKRLLQKVWVVSWGKWSLSWRFSCRKFTRECPWDQHLWRWRKQVWVEAGAKPWCSHCKDSGLSHMSSGPCTALQNCAFLGKKARSLHCPSRPAIACWLPTGKFGQDGSLWLRATSLAAGRMSISVLTWCWMAHHTTLTEKMVQQLRVTNSNELRKHSHL